MLTCTFFCTGTQLSVLCSLNLPLILLLFAITVHFAKPTNVPAYILRSCRILHWVFSARSFITVPVLVSLCISLPSSLPRACLPVSNLQVHWKKPINPSLPSACKSIDRSVYLNSGVTVTCKRINIFMQSGLHRCLVCSGLDWHNK